MTTAVPPEPLHAGTANPATATTVRLVLALLLLLKCVCEVYLLLALAMLGGKSLDKLGGKREWAEAMRMWGLSENPCLRFIQTKTKYKIMCQKPCARKLRASTAQGWRKPLIHELWLNASHVVNSENSRLHGESAQAPRKRA